MTMKNEVLEEIKEFAKNKLMKTYGFCGSAEGDDMAMLNSSDRQGNEIKITINSELED
jgi:hypothetical protein